MSTLPRKETPKSGTLFHSNPILSRLGKVTERTETNMATYAGIASKTTYFLLMTLGGIVLQLFVMSLMKAQPVWQTIQIYKGFEVAITKPEVIIVGVTLLVGFISELIGIREVIQPVDEWADVYDKLYPYYVDLYRDLDKDLLRMRNMWIELNKARK